MDDAWPYMTWRERWVCLKWDIRYFFRCHDYWFTKTDRIGLLVPGNASLFHTCQRHRWHRGPHRDRLGLEQAL
jgi:hypothetical protein